MVCSPPRPLSQFTEAWQALPGVSEWVMKSIKNGYTLQFFRRPPRFNGVLMSTVRERNASVLREEIHNLLAKRAVEAVSLTDRESGFYSRYFLVPKKDGGLRPILNLRPLNRALSKPSFKMITLRQILSHIRPGDWFISVDLKDAYFHIQVAPRHRCFLRFAFEGIAYQFTVLPFGLCLAPRTFKKCMDAALSPLKQSGMRILNYLDDWLVLALSESALLSDKFRLLAHIQGLGLTVNMQKSMLVPSQNISFLGVELNSINMQARLSEERSQKLISSLAVFKLGRSPPLKCFQRTLGQMAAASTVCNLGLLHMRPLQLWLKSRVPQNACRTGTLRIKVTRNCLHMLTPWHNMTLYRQGVCIGQVIRRKNVTTDASSTGWGAVCDGRPAFGTWSEMEKSWHINCLELRAVHLALECFLPDILHRHVLIRADSMTVVAFINHQGCVNSQPLLRLARDLLLWADRHLLSIRAVHVPGRLNCGVDLLSRGGVIHRE